MGDGGATQNGRAPPARIVEERPPMKYSNPNNEYGRFRIALNVGLAAAVTSVLAGIWFLSRG